MSSKVEDIQATMRHVKNLSFNRTTGSVGETEAVLYVQNELQKNGIISYFEYFEYLGFKRIFMRIAYIIILSYMILYKLLLIVVAYFSIKHLSARARNFSLIAKESSKNLIVELPAQKLRKNRPVAILTAHYDSFSANLPYRLQSILFFIFRTIIFPYMAITLVFSLWIFFDVYAADREEVVRLIFLTSIAEIVITFLVFLLLFATKKSLGSIDNASGVSILIETAKYLKKNPQQNLDVIIIFTGAEEWGLIGSKRYLRTHKNYLKEKYDLDRSFNINFDMIGTYIGLFHQKKLSRKKMDKSLKDYIQKAAKKANIIYRNENHFINPKTDHRSFISFARKTKSNFQVSCFHSYKDSKYIHSPRDTPDKCSSTNLNGVLQIILDAINKYDADLYD